jgi:hypothetical protein
MKIINRIKRNKFIFQIKLIYLLLLTFQSFSCMKLKGIFQRKEVSGDNIGLNLYHSGVVTQTMKRPQWWFLNVMMQKPNEKYFEEAEYNGLRYQTELLQDKLDREYNDSIRDFYDEKMNVYEQKLISAMKIQKKFNEKKAKPKL